jgi:hypothetical protein
MPMFRKKPVEIEAVQWNGEVIVGGCPPWLAAVGEVVAEAPADLEDGRTVFCGDRVLIGTREGTMQASPGDWIIKGTAGELYPCKPAIFAEIYEPVTIGRTELGSPQTTI